MDPMIVDALALGDGVMFAKIRGFRDVIMEMDCLEVVHLRNPRHNSCSVVALLILEIGDLSSSFIFHYSACSLLLQLPVPSLCQTSLFVGGD